MIWVFVIWFSLTVLTLSTKSVRGCGGRRRASADAANKRGSSLLERWRNLLASSNLPGSRSCSPPSSACLALLSRCKRWDVLVLLVSR